MQPTPHSGGSRVTSAPEPDAGPPCAVRFRTTHWSVVQLAGHDSSPDAAAALEALCRAYWYPLYAYVRRRGYDVPEAQDLTQEFFARLLRTNSLAGVDRGKGRFRSFLLAALKHFLANEWDRARAEKRGGGQPVIPLDQQTAETRYALEPVSDLTPEKIYEQRWALTLLAQALARLRAEQAATGKEQQFDLFKGFLTSEPASGEYEKVAKQLSVSPGAVAVAVHRLRHRYRDLVRDEVAQTVASPAEVEEELHALFQALAG